MDKVEGRFQVYIQNCIPLSLTHTKHQTVLSDTCVVNENIDRTEICVNLLNGLLSLLEVSSITSICAACYTKSLNLLASSLQASCHIIIEYEVCECDVSTLRSKFHSDSLTYAASCTCYKGSFTC